MENLVLFKFLMELIAIKIHRMNNVRALTVNQLQMLLSVRLLSTAQPPQTYQNALSKLLIANFIQTTQPVQVSNDQR